MLDIIKVPNPILHKKCKKIVNFDSAIRSLVKDMRETMKANDGIGLAAPQIGKSIALCIVEIPTESKRYRHIKNFVSSPFTVLINPKIIQVSNKRATELEGCLSIPGVGVKVERPIGIIVRAQDEYGKTQEIKASALFARAIQHEIDHLNGILITDYGQSEPFEN